MTRDELLEKLKSLETDSPDEFSHVEADLALLDFINDPEITEAYHDIAKWYA